ncbi:MAG: S8 family serine peptidase [Phycisphaerae bacterium]|nr:S8 family serine peptidase [Phycisphaerae bacterium]
MNRKLMNVVIVVLPVFALAMPASGGEVRWVAGKADLAKMDSSQLTATLTALASRSDGRRIVVQFDQPMTPTQRSELESSGLTLLNYLGDNAYFATLLAERLDPVALAGVDGLSSVSAIAREWKLHPFLNDGNFPTWAAVSPEEREKGDLDDAIVGVYVLFHRDVVLDRDAVGVCLSHGARIRSMLHSVNGLVVEVPFGNIGELADEDAVQWVEPALPKFSEMNNDSRARTGADIVQAAPYDLDGSGVTVLVYDGGHACAEHPDFGGRLTVRDSSESSGHATHVSGIIGGDGTLSDGLYKGMAPGVTIESYGFEQEDGIHEGFLYSDPGDIEADYNEAINVHGADISNNSLGTNTAFNEFPCEWEGNYGVTANLIDSIVRGSLGAPFRIVWANGNERNMPRCGATYHTTAPPACAKNHIAVGALHSNDDSMTWFSSWGPCDDDRMRPDVSAPGCQSDDDNGITSCSGCSGYDAKCGTSMASPAVCGLGALLLQDYRACYPSEPDFRNSTLKILLAHTAVDTEEPGPDYKTGYGSVRIQPAVELLRSGNFLEDEVGQGQTFTLLAVVGPGDTELKVTLAWDDFPGTPNVIPVLVNNLDLRVFSPSGVEAYPWTLGGLANPEMEAVRTRANHVDNIEQVLVDSPEEGAWVIEVHGCNVPEGPQPFSLCATPSLFTCLSQGIVSLDKGSYSCESTATIQVVDCDLNLYDQGVETVLVTIESGSEPGGEVVSLTETGPDTAAFVGTIPLSETDAAGVLLVATGDTVTVTYNDADDGHGGINVPVIDTAVVDCAASQITNVQSQSTEPRTATITFDTDEPTLSIIRYGLSCASLTEMVTGNYLQTNHNVNLTGLLDDTTHFFAVEAEDEAGNLAGDDNGGACYSFTTPDIPNYFTEEFSWDNDLGHTRLAFTPNAGPDYYSGCAESISSLPTDPAGGAIVSLPGNDFHKVTLADGKTVSLYGISYSGFYICANGYITFPIGDKDYSESLEDHFDRPRVSMLFDELDPDEGTVSWKQLADRAVVTYQNVPESSEPTTNTFQVELYFDGRIVLSYLDIAATDGIVGLSNGEDIPADFYETDLSAMGDCSPQPPINPGTEANTTVSTPVTIALSAFDDGLPASPGALTYIITSLPGHGTLTDPGSGLISTVPHSLAGYGNEVDYQPETGYGPADSFEYKASDGGSPPQGGDSNVAQVAITIGGPGWNPVAYDMEQSIYAYTPTGIELLASDPNDDPLSYIIESLPAAGFLMDPGGGVIGMTPYTLVGGGNVVTYQPPCGESVIETFDFSARDATAGSNVATVTVTVGASEVVYWFPLDDNPGWGTEGLWAFGQPTGGGSHKLDPDCGYTGQNVYGYNLSGDYENSLTAVRYLTTTIMDCSTLSNTELRFWRWLGIESGYSDHANVEVSNNGTDWSTVWEHSGSSISEDSWSQQTYDISQWADGQPTVQVRWGMGMTDSSVTYPGWNIDDIEIWAFAGLMVGDLDEDGDVDLEDIRQFTICFGVDITADPSCTCANVDTRNTVVDVDDWKVLEPLLTGPQ